MRSVSHKFEFTTKVYGSNLKFHAMEASFHLLLKPGEHLIEVAHPYESVDADAFLTACERRVEQTAFASVLKVEQSRLQAEEDRRVGP